MNAAETRAYKYKINKIKNPPKPDIRAADAARAKAPPKRFMADVKAMFKPKKTHGSGGVFFDSLSAMTPGDIVLNEVAQNVKKPPVDLLRYFMLLLSLGIFAYAGFNIVDRIAAYVSAAREHVAVRALFYEYDEVQPEAEILRRTRANVPIQDILSLQKQTGERVVEAEVSDVVRDVERGRRSMQRVADKNKDLYCWIKMSNTRIDYPVVQTTNNDYYLHYSFEGKRNPSGAIFVDYNNSRDIMKNLNTVIYGHNMLDGSMFQPIIDFGRYKDYFATGIIELITEDAVYYYEVFSAREEDPSSGYIETYFRDEEEWIEFVYEMQDRSNFTKNLRFDEDTRIVTLSTCINDTSRNWRFVVQGVLVDIK